MQRRTSLLAPITPFFLLLATGCGSTAKTTAQAPAEPAGPPPMSIDASETASVVTDGIMAEMTEPGAAMAVEEDVHFGPKPWTGAFTETAIMLTRTARIEGPEGMLDHIVASSDDAFYERTIETTPEGLLQTVRRMGKDAPEIRVRLDRWTIAVEESVVILERITPGPVKLIASGDALWRDVDGHLAQANRLEFIGQIGDDTPLRPENTHVREEPKTQPDAESDSGSNPGSNPESNSESNPGSNSGSNSGSDSGTARASTPGATPESNEADGNAVGGTESATPASGPDDGATEASNG